MHVIMPASAGRETVASLGCFGGLSRTLQARRRKHANSAVTSQPVDVIKRTDSDDVTHGIGKHVDDLHFRGISFK